MPWGALAEQMAEQPESAERANAAIRDYFIDKHRNRAKHGATILPLDLAKHPEILDKDWTPPARGY